MADGEIKGTVGGNPLILVQGDISAVATDAVMVPEFTGAASYGGVGGALARAGCLGGLEAYDKIVGDEGPFKFGMAVLTPSGGGTAPNLIHVVSAGAPAEHQFAVAKASMRNALHLAEKSGIASLAVPALCTGIIGALTGVQSAQAMLSGIAEHVEAGGASIEVRVVTFRSPSTHADFAKVMEDGSYVSADVEQIGERPFDLARWDSGMAYDHAANDKAFGTRP